MLEGGCVVHADVLRRLLDGRLRPVLQCHHAFFVLLLPFCLRILGQFYLGVIDDEVELLPACWVGQLHGLVIEMREL